MAKHDFTVILNEVKDLKSIKIRDASLSLKIARGAGCARRRINRRSPRIPAHLATGSVFVTSVSVKPNLPRVPGQPVPLAVPPEGEALGRLLFV